MKQFISILFMLLLGLPCMAQDTQEHVVKIGEDFATIAAKYGITEKQLLDMNPKGRGVLYVGMKLKVPKVARKAAPEPAAVTPAAKSKKDKKAEAKAKKEAKSKSSKSKKDMSSAKADNDDKKAKAKADKEAKKAEKEAKKAEKAAARKAKLEARKNKKKK